MCIRDSQYSRNTRELFGNGKRLRKETLHTAGTVHHMSLIHISVLDCYVLSNGYILLLWAVGSLADIADSTHSTLHHLLCSHVFYSTAVSYTHLDVYKRKSPTLLYDYRLSWYGMDTCIKCPITQ